MEPLNQIAANPVQVAATVRFERRVQAIVKTIPAGATPDEVVRYTRHIELAVKGCSAKQLARMVWPWQKQPIQKKVLRGKART
jgi:hypothetical protein